MAQQNPVQYSKNITNEGDDHKFLYDHFFVRKWTIKNFKALNLATKKVTGPPCKVYVKGYGETVFWIQISKVEHKVHFQVACSLPTSIGCWLWLLVKKTSIGNVSTIKSQTTFSFKEKNLPLVGGALEMYLHCRIQTNYFIAEKSPTPGQLEINMNREDLEFLSDFEIECEGRKFPVHKLILTTHSDVFRAMFTHKNTEENKKNKVIIMDMSAETLDCMLQMMYTQKVPNNLTQVDLEALLEASNKYNFCSLNSYCEKILKDRFLNWENSARLMLIGLKFNSKALADKAKQVVMDNIQRVIQTKEYEELMRAYPDAFTKQN